ncbi:ubiquitin conjugating enzyme [Aspergillus sclerotialis]|uniref:Ubiquitin conjugating enzyme n=1 Tax=Aspergillus sclerotialis TaxID=2070753 RepID=A0A3A2ZLI7_9EURO|nr:ubiquitin conjugating enzyme [Aspergillus sclerotialis]
MSLGMGPNIEWEIRSHPYVVDLLISFAYSRAMSKQLTDFPAGPGFKFPRIFAGDLPHSTSYAATLDTSKMTILVKECPDLKTGDWILITIHASGRSWHGNRHLHCRIKDTKRNPLIQLCDPVYHGPPKFKQQDLSVVGKPVKFVVYDGNFDDIKADSAKRDTVIMLLETLPSVEEMASFVDSNLDKSNIMLLSSWKERISPSALDLLRWIVASNRSCIVYDDDPEHQVTDMKGYMQFRLAHGAPDKERRFLSAVNATSERLKLHNPTLFAWHGSALENWHSILREGLHFKKVIHGRTFGNGVYLSRSFTTSLEYARSKKKAPSVIVPQDSKHVPYGPNGSPITIPISAVGSRRIQAEAAKKPRRSNRISKISEKVKKRGSSRKGTISKTNTLPDASDEVAESDGDGDADSVATLAEDCEFLQLDKDTETAEADEADDVKSRKDEYLTKTDFRPGMLKESSVKLLGAPDLKVQEREPLHELGWYIDKELISNIYQWIVKLHSFDPELPLAKDLKKAKLTSIVLEFRFPSDFPLSPPFVRIIRPRMLPWRMGGGGQVTAGGPMCMELLTSSGWTPVTTIESLLMHVRVALSNTDPVPARLEAGNKNEYSVGEAVEAYKRVCNMHGWKIPADINKIDW